ncbi:MAG: hypothetical protein H6932_17280 [Burkholderiaceae bacterium]|nr:hypothetical protein [Burkholderiaceae bacterium]
MTGPVTDHVRAGAVTSTVLLDDDEIRIEHFERGGAGGTLVVTFDPIAYFWDRPPFGHEFLRKQSLDVIAVRKKSENFYQPLSREAFDAAVAPVAARYARVFSYGSSLGAYAALYFGRDEPWTVIASSPRNSSHPVYGAKVWQKKVPFRHEPMRPDVTPRCNAIILYDPRDGIDRRYLDGEVLPQFPDADVRRVPFSGHPSNQVLSEMGFIAPFVRAVLSGSPRATWPTLDRRGARQRSAAYFQVMAQHAVQKQHIACADALVARSLALKPASMLALRVQGTVRLAQRRWTDAEAVLAQALALSPQDPLTQSLLDRARRGQPAPPPPPPQPITAPPPGRRERLAALLRRMARLVGGRR